MKALDGYVWVSILLTECGAVPFVLYILLLHIFVSYCTSTDAS